MLVPPPPPGRRSLWLFGLHVLARQPLNEPE